MALPHSRSDHCMIRGDWRSLRSSQPGASLRCLSSSLHISSSGGRCREDVMTTIATESHHWPTEGLTRVPYWVYSDSGIYEEEQARIFRGPTWQFLCLEAELPSPNSYRRSSLGAMPVVVTRDKDGELHAFENRCAHRGSLLVLNESGEARDIVCIYHNWSYDLCGNLTGVTFRHCPPATGRALRSSPRPSSIA